MLYLVRIKIDWGENNKNEYYKTNEWYELFKHNDKVCKWKIDEKGMMEFALGMYTDKIEAINDGKMLYFNILYDLHRNEHGFKLGDGEYVIQRWYGDCKEDFEKFIDNEEWFIIGKKHRFNPLGLAVFEADNLEDYEKSYKSYGIKWTAINNEPFKFFARIQDLDESYKYSEKSQEIFRLISLSEKADEKTSILLLCQALETMGENEKKSDEEINEINKCIELINKSGLAQDQKSSILGMLQFGKNISSRKKCLNLVEKYCFKEYKHFDKEKVINEAYVLRSKIIHGEKILEDTDYSCGYFLKFIVLDVLKEWAKI